MRQPNTKERNYWPYNIRPGAIVEGVDPDNVHSPQHYTKGKIEVIDFILDQQLDFISGNIIKYVCRARHKGKLKEDLEKARWYLNKLLETLDEQ